MGKGESASSARFLYRVGQRMAAGRPHRGDVPHVFLAGDGSRQCRPCSPVLRSGGHGGRTGDGRHAESCSLFRPVEVQRLLYLRLPYTRGTARRLGIEKSNWKNVFKRVGHGLIFYTHDGRRISPLYDIHRQRYVVYWRLIWEE